MIDLADLRSRPDDYQKAAKNKGIDVSIKDFLKLDEKRRTIVPDVEEMRAKKNEVSKQVPSMKGKEKDKALAEMKKLNEDLKKKEGELALTEEAWKSMQLLLPTIPHESVPVGSDESGNVEVAKWGISQSLTSNRKTMWHSVKRSTSSISRGV